MKNIVIFGATSGIAHEFIRAIIKKEKAHFILIARNEKRLSDIRNEIISHSCTADTIICNALDIQEVVKSSEKVQAITNKINVLLIAHGTLPDNEAIYNNYDKIADEYNINLLSTITFITGLIPIFSQTRSGTIAVISSVAGDRGRGSNFIYGSAKAAISAYLSGLRNKMLEFNVHVLTIKPGFVDTNMTKDIPKNPLFVKPQKVASDILNAIEKKKDVIYTPFFWRYIMIIIKLIPEGIFKKLKI